VNRAPQLALAVALLLALIARTAGLSVYGFSEDEVAKLRAIDAYRQGDFSPNAEHPMLMKLAIWASLSAADAWNGLAPSALTVAPETALRLPNALAGTVTVAAIYGIAAIFFGPPVGLVAALLVALDPNVIAINRIGKEDTFLMLFFMLAVFFYERGKRVGAADPVKAQPSYNLAGVSFGLMLASKYMPHFFGLYAMYNLAFQRRAGANVPRTLPYNGRIIASFLVANFTILLPSTWAYCLAYLRGEHSAHHGLFYNGELHTNFVLFFGVPAVYYLHLLATKVPIPILMGALVGLAPLVSRRRERGYVWLRVLLVMTLLSYSVIGPKFQRYALPMMLLIDMLAAIGLVTAFAWIRDRGWPHRLTMAAYLMGAVSIAGPLVSVHLRMAPFYSVYQNAIGAALAPPATVFPEEAYDFGLREAVTAIAEVAKPGALLVSDATMAVEYYSRQAGRGDLASRSLSLDGLAPRGDQWVVVQDGHLYFENASVVAQIRRSMSPWREYRLAGTTVLQVYRLTR
jgi:hypothetical protein